MHWLRLRPESPEELDMVDCRGRWINDEEEYDDDEEEEPDRQMEDFDPVCFYSHSIFKSLRYVQDAVDDDDEEEEDEEEDEPGIGPMQGQQLHGRRHTERPLHLELPQQTLSGRASPVSPGAPQTPDDKSLIDLSVYTSTPVFEPGSRLGRVRMAKQLTTPQRTGWAGSAQV